MLADPAAVVNDAPQTIATLSSGTEVYAPAPARRLYALEVAAGQTLDAPVDSAFDWTGAWTVAAWLKAGVGASGAVLTLGDGAATPNVAAAVQAEDLTPGQWTHVALAHAVDASTAALHVDGGAGTPVAFSGLATGGSVQISGAAVDDLRVYQQDLSANVTAAGAPPASACTIKQAPSGECSYDNGYYFQFETGNDCFDILGSPSGSTDLASHSNAPDTNVNVHRNGVKIGTNVALKINWGNTTTIVCNGRLASGAAENDWKDDDVLVLYTP